MGGSDPDTNSKLAAAIARARAAHMPRDRITSALDKATGSGSKGGTVYEALMFEAYGPGGSGLLIEATTDNRNRTSQMVALALKENRGSSAGEGGVSWQFERMGVMVLEGGVLLDDENAATDVLEVALTVDGVEDVQQLYAGNIVSDEDVAAILNDEADPDEAGEGVEQTDSDFAVRITCEPASLQALKLALSDSDGAPNGQPFAVDQSGIDWVAKTLTEISADDMHDLGLLVGALENIEDVTTVTSNATLIPE